MVHELTVNCVVGKEEFRHFHIIDGANEKMLLSQTATKSVG